MVETRQLWTDTPADSSRRMWQVMLIGKFITLKFTGLRHWPLGATYSVVLLVSILGLLGVYFRLGGNQEVFTERNV